MCTAFARLGDDDQTNRCIERLLAAEPDDMKWLLENVEIGNRRSVFLNSFIEGRDQDDLARALSSPQIATRALNLLANNLSQFAFAAARIVALPTISAPDHIKLGLKIHRILKGTDRAMLAQSIVSRVLMDEAVQGGDLPERVMAAVINHIDVRAAIALGLNTDLDGKQVSRTLVTFDRAVPAVRTVLKPYADVIVQLIASRRDFDLTVDGAMATARLIDTAAQLDRHTYLKICSTILPFAVAARGKPASPLIIATFPAIYDGMRKDSDNFGLMKFFMFVELDKCKIARKDLVRAFMRSEWPPADLAVTAYRACELNRILKRLIKEPGGRSYLAKVEDGAQGLQAVIRKQVLKAIKEVRGSGTFIPESET